MGLKIKPSILVAEGADNIRTAIAESFFGFDCTVASDGEEALDILTKGDIDLVVLDTDLPITNGWEAIRIIRDKDGWPDMPIVVTSSGSEPEDALKAWYFDCYFVSKPYSMKHLCNIVASLLQKVAREGVKS